MNAIANDAEIFIWKERCDTLFSAWVQVRYHKRRQRFFDLSDKITKALTLLLSASLVGQVLKESAPLLAATISFLGLLALIFGYGDRKQQHKEFAEQSAKLIAAIEKIAPDQLTSSIVAGFKADYAEICAKAPPPLKTLTIICEHEQAVVNGHPDHIKRPSLFVRFFADFVS